MDFSFEWISSQGDGISFDCFPVILDFEVIVPFVDEDDWIRQFFDNDVWSGDLNDVAGDKNIILSRVSDESLIIVGHIMCYKTIKECCWIMFSICSEFGDGISDFVGIWAVKFGSAAVENELSAVCVLRDFEIDPNSVLVHNLRGDC